MPSAKLLKAGVMRDRNVPLLLRLNTNSILLKIVMADHWMTHVVKYATPRMQCLHTGKD